jgi:hypothetical protein
MKVAKFEDGTPTEWIEVMNALEAIWKQNALTTASDRQASVKTILREDALTNLKKKQLIMLQQSKYQRR